VVLHAKKVRPGIAWVKKNRNVTRFSVIPAKAGIHKPMASITSLWIPAFAGMTEIIFTSPVKMHISIHKKIKTTTKTKARSYFA
jgi:hypothetical protein